MSQQMPDENRTVNLAAPAGVAKPRSNTPLILGGVGCLFLILLLACGGAVGYYFYTRNQVAQLIPTQFINTPVIPTVVIPTLDAPAAALATGGFPTEPALST